MREIKKICITSLLIGSAIAFVWGVWKQPKEILDLPTLGAGWQPTIILDSAVGKIRLHQSQIQYANRFTSDPLNAGTSHFSSDTAGGVYSFWLEKIKVEPSFSHVQNQCPTANIWFAVDPTGSSVRVIGACSQYTHTKEFKIVLSPLEFRKYKERLNTLERDVRRHENPLDFRLYF